MEYVDTESSDLVVNHKWVIEYELTALESDAQTDEEETINPSDNQTSSESKSESESTEE